MSTDENGFDRRTVLKHAGIGAGISLAGLSGGVAADEQFDQELVERMAQSSSIQNILAEIGASSFSTDAVRTYSLWHGTSAAFAPLSAGTLVYAESSSGNADAMLTIEEPSRLSAYTDLPTGTEPVLFGTSDGTELRRRATDEERRAVESIVGVENQETVIYTGDGIDGFRIDILPDGPEADRVRRFEVTPSDGRSLDTTAETVEPFVGDNGVSATDLIPDPGQACDDCCPPCVSCVASIGTCARCYFVCAGSPTGVGAVLCVACLKLFCEVGGTVSCALCVDCLQDNGHI